MSMSFVFLFLSSSALFFSICSGNWDSATAAAIEGAAVAVQTCLSLTGNLCLWSGILELVHECGLSVKITHLFHPFLKYILPQASQNPETLSAISANLSANFFGLGNAATPLGIRAAEKMAAGCNGVASDELCLLVVLNTASIQLLPTTVVALRSGYGCKTPFDLLPAVWATSLFSVTAGLMAARCFSRLERRLP